MDWLLQRQPRIEKKLSQRHLTAGGIVLYDLTSSYFEGVTCPLASLGHPHDGKKGKLQVNYGLLTDQRGCPIAVEVFPGNTLDHQTLMLQVKKMKERFGIETMVLVGDRGMITQKLIDEKLRDSPGVDWITALRSGAILKLVKDNQVQIGLFDQVNLFEITTPEYPGERLIVCRNPELAKLRTHKRQALLDATIKKLQEVQSTVEGGKLRGKAKISRRLEDITKQHKVVEHFTFTVRDDGFDVCVDDKAEASKAALAGALEELGNIESLIRRGKVNGKDPIDQRVNRVITKYNLGEYVKVDTWDAGFDLSIEDHAGASVAAFGSVTQEIDRVRSSVQFGKYGGQDKIGVRVGKVVNKYKVAKHFALNIRDDGLEFKIDDEKVAAEAALDGIYIVRTSLTAQRLCAEDTVRSYKSLSEVERAFRSLKTVDLKVRPIRHRLEERVRAHIFLCMLAYYVEWHMREAWCPLLFADEDQERLKTRDPVAPATRSDAALEKVHTKRLEDGTEAHSFKTLLKLMSQIVRNECKVKGGCADAPTFEIVTTPDEKQERAYDLIEKIVL